MRLGEHGDIPSAAAAGGRPAPLGAGPALLLSHTHVHSVESTFMLANLLHSLIKIAIIFQRGNL